MVHIVPPLVAEAPLADVQPTTAAPTPVALSRIDAADIEQFAAEGAALITEEAPARPVVPPPLPRELAAAPADSVTTSARPGVLITAGAAAAVLAIGVIAWFIAWHLQDDPVPVVAEAVNQPELSETTQRPETASGDDHAVKSPGISGAVQNESVAEPPQANLGNQSTQVARPGESVEDEIARGVDAAGERQAEVDAAAVGEVESPIAKPNASGGPADTAKQPSAQRWARKPAIKLDELPESDLPDPDAIAAQSAGQEAAKTAEQEATSQQEAPPVEPAVRDEVPDAVAPPLRRVAPDKIDVAARLATEIAAIQLRGAPLHTAAETFSDMAGVPVALDVDALRAAGVRVDQPVTLAATSVTIAGALEQALRPPGLEAREQNGCLVVLPMEAGQTRKARYAVDDLVRSGDPPIEDLVEMVRAVVAGRVVAGEGNSPAVTAEKGAILLSAREIEHDRMIELCEKLRVARGRPLRTRFDANRPDPRFDPRRFELATRRAKALDVLARPVTAGVGRGAPLCDVIEFLAGQTGATILMDHAALSAAGLAAQTDARLVAAGEPLETAVARLLEPLSLTMRVVDHKVLEVTTLEAAAQRVYIEFYPVRGTAGRRVLAAGDLEPFREKLLAAAGIAGSNAAIEFDPPSECLIVCASYPEQVRIEQGLRKLDRP
jgi:hypothetical protein